MRLNSLTRMRLTGRRSYQRIVFGFFLLVAVYYYIARPLLKMSPRDDLEVYELLSRHLDLLNSSRRECVRPQLELWNDRLREIFAAPLPLNCSASNGGEHDWVYVNDAKFYVTDEAIRKHGSSVDCEYIPIHRGSDDFEVLQGTPIKSISSGTPITSDVFRVKCESSDGQTYTNVHLAILPNKELIRRSHSLSEQLPSDALRLNIIMFGFDSVSRLTWMRNLPKSYKYLTDTLESVVMEGYNVVGDGTPQALLPILTGMTEPELPEARRGFADAQPVDNHPWIWSNLTKFGYITQWGEESPEMGTFTYRMLGFTKQPVDHYMRTFHLAAASQSKQNNPHCHGSQTGHQLMFQYGRDFLDAYRDQLKFSFLFHSKYSHDANSKLRWADEDLLKYLVYLRSSGHLNSSLLVLMSDHGARFQSVRATEQGKYEERLPFLAIRVPRWFSRTYPEAVKNLKANAGKLTTPFDLHETFKDVISFSRDRRTKNGRGYSLFSSIPANRSCFDADIEPHWCTCLEWRSVSKGSFIVRRASNEVISAINRLTQSHADKCTRLVVGDIISAVKYAAGSDLLRFRQSADIHGRKADLSDDMKATVEFYQVTFTAQPSNALYEATVKRLMDGTGEGQFTVNIHDISRINRYGSQPECVAEQCPHLRPFCYCNHA